jgi:hypothetical protein
VWSLSVFACAQLGNAAQRPRVASDRLMGAVHELRLPVEIVVASQREAAE